MSDAESQHTILRQALEIARDGKTALVIVPNRMVLRECLNILIRSVDTQHEPISVNHEELQFIGTRGGVRLYTVGQVEWDPDRKRHRGYPVDTPTFVIE